MNYIDGTTCSVSVRRLSSFPAASALPRLFMSTLLTTSIQIAAGIVSLYNDFVISSWGRPLGFLNPLLYSRGFRDFGFKDIKFGGNPGCGTNGFMADTGWDPVRPLCPFFRVILMLADFVLCYRPRV